MPKLIHPPKLHRGDTIAIVSLSDGVLGEDFVQHEVVLMEQRLKEVFDLNFKYMPNSRRGIQYLKEHPEAKAADLREAFLDDNVQMIWCALGGDDTFRTIPYLDNDDFRQIIQKHPKIFLGMSDTTNNHLLLNKLGLATFYGPALMSDIAELGPEIFPFTVEWLQQFFNSQKNIEIKSAPIWYGARTSFGPDQLGIPRPEHPEQHGHEYLFGQGIVEGELFGGCLDSIFEMLAGGRYDDQLTVFDKHPLFPPADQLKNKVLFLETSEEQPSPDKYQKMLGTLAQRKIFENVSALLVGKPQDEAYYNEYREILQKIARQYKLPLVYNLNFGHTTPRIVLPYGAPVRIDFDQHKITLSEGMGFAK